MDNEVERRKSYPCPESKQTVYYPYPRCNLNDKPCVLAMDELCPTYEDYLSEVRQEELDRQREQGI